MLARKMIGILYFLLTIRLFYIIESIQFSTSGIHWFVVPAGTLTVNVELVGGCGGSGYSNGGTTSGGLGGILIANISLAERSNCTITVGGLGNPASSSGPAPGGYNGGGEGGAFSNFLGSYGGGSGGGLTDLRLGSTIIAVAGGGGGGSTSGNGGGGGGCSGSTNPNGCQPSSTGATDSAGGVSLAGSSYNGAYLLGGSAPATSGGGGGGYYGGGGGANLLLSGGSIYGGGGGSSYCSSSYCVTVAYSAATSCSGGSAKVRFIAANPTVAPSTPSFNPTSSPTTLIPSAGPTLKPSTILPSFSPSTKPSTNPTTIPTACPSLLPTVLPSISPSKSPLVPSVGPSTLLPSLSPSMKPSTYLPTSIPTASPSSLPTLLPSTAPSKSPLVPSAGPSTMLPSYSPSAAPTTYPTTIPSASPSSLPTVLPSIASSRSPTAGLSTLLPSFTPSAKPSNTPSGNPSLLPSLIPSISSSGSPTFCPTPSVVPSSFPSTIIPTYGPSIKPSSFPSASPSSALSVVPSASPSVTPSGTPTLLSSSTIPPTSVKPSTFPSVSPSILPSIIPTQFPSTTLPTYNPSAKPSTFPPSLVSPASLSGTPNGLPSSVPLYSPTAMPTVMTTSLPSFVPSICPSLISTVSPTLLPSFSPTTKPSAFPSLQPILVSTALPSVAPNGMPSSIPLFSPTTVPKATSSPSAITTSLPSMAPSIYPSLTSTVSPIILPTSRGPTLFPPTLLPISSPSTISSAVPSSAPSLTLNPSPSVPSRISSSGPTTLSPSTLPPTSTKPSTIPSATTLTPTFLPSYLSSVYPTYPPSSYLPKGSPSIAPTYCPSGNPSIVPSAATSPPLSSISNPSIAPTVQNTYTISPSQLPSSSTTFQQLTNTAPANNPSIVPSQLIPSFVPTVPTSSGPTSIPSVEPSFVLSNKPSDSPSFLSPSVSPSSGSLSNYPVAQPSNLLTMLPSTNSPSIPVSVITPSDQPSWATSITPSTNLNVAPLALPTISPSNLPSGSTAEPTTFSVPPSKLPTPVPTSLAPVKIPTILPSTFPSAFRTPSTTPSLILTSFPSLAPSISTTKLPSKIPSVASSLPPIYTPSKVPTLLPTLKPTSYPSLDPSSEPTAVPSVANTPSTRPTAFPSDIPNNLPIFEPTFWPTAGPSTTCPSNDPSAVPSQSPSVSDYPTVSTSTSPSLLQSETPSELPSAIPSIFSSISVVPSIEPSASLTENPTFSSPSAEPSIQSTSIIPSIVFPSESPSESPSNFPSSGVTLIPTEQPTSPSAFPSTASPTATSNSELPTSVPTEPPSLSSSVILIPTEQPTSSSAFPPTASPTATSNSELPTSVPTEPPSLVPSLSSSAILIPTEQPTLSSSFPSTASPTATSNSELPTSTPTEPPSLVPSFVPSCTTTFPSSSPTENPSASNSLSPSAFSAGPTEVPTFNPSNFPTLLPTDFPSTNPPVTTIPSSIPSSTNVPTTLPTAIQSYIPTAIPSNVPTVAPTSLPTIHSSNQPSSGAPSKDPSSVTTSVPTSLPTTPITVLPTPPPTTVTPTVKTSNGPSYLPSIQPSFLTTTNPSTIPSTLHPTAVPTATPSLAKSRSPSTIAPSAAPVEPVVNIIKLSSPQTLTNFNTQLKLLLVASIQSSTGCLSNWTTSDPSLDLNSVALLSVSQFIPPRRVTIVQLYLSANVLSVQRSYLFKFHCDRFSSILVVNTTAPPANGLFVVHPSTGYELVTIFTYSANSWISSNLPLSFQFGYIDSKTGNNLAVSENFLLATVSSKLPAGSQALGYRINCTLAVFDSLSASARRQYVVTVHPSNSSVMNNYINSHLSTSTSASSIAIISNLLNAANCTGVSNCARYNRLPCSTVDFTCGECLNGFVGSLGPQNSICVLPTVNFRSTARTCRTDSDCGVVNMCNVTSRTCYLPSKGCPNACSSHGTCGYRAIDTGLAVPSCKVTSANCIAVCTCESGYGGLTCSLTWSQLTHKQSQRNQLLQSFNNLTYQNLSNDAIVSRAVTLSSLTQIASELSLSAISAAVTATSNLLHSAVQAGVSYEDIATVLTAADSIASAIQNSNHSSSQLLNTISLFGSITVSQLVGEQTIDNILSNYRMSTSSPPKSGTSLTVPLTPFEELQSAVSSAIFFQQNISSSSSVKLSLVEASAKLLDDDLPYLSNPLVVLISNIKGLNASNGTAGGHDLLVALKNFEPVVESAPQNFTTVCTKAKDTSHKIINFTCPESGYVLFHNCSNKVGVLTSYCPVRRPSCQTVSVIQTSSHSVCRTVNYTSTLTWCHCTIHPSHTRRNLGSVSADSVLEDSGALQLVAMTELVTNDFKNTFSAASELTNPQNIEKALIVILMFSILWSVGLSLLFLCNWRRQAMKKKNEKDLKQLERQRRGAEISQSPASVREYLSNYIIEIFPAVFKHKSRLHQAVEEIRNHHRYLSLFLTKETGASADHARTMKVFQVLTIQTMLMFLLALLYDLQCPSDDGSCEKFHSRATCLARTSPLDSSQSYCSWANANSNDDVHAISFDSSPLCSYKEPEVTLKMVLIIAILVSIFTAIFLRPIEYLFELLHSPTADADKMQTFNASIEKRVVNAARRASVALSKAAQSAVQKLSITKKKVVGTEVRLVPVSTEAAQELARASVSLIVPAAKQLMIRQHFETMALKTKIRESREPVEVDRDSNDSILSGNDDSKDHDQSDDNDDDSSDSQYSIDNNNNNNNKDLATLSASPTKRSVTTNTAANQFLSQPTQKLMDELSEELSMQRRYLRTSELEEFDRQWGIDPTGEFVREERLGFCIQIKAGARETIAKEIDSVKKMTLQKIDKLKLATDEHTGLEILHLFILDLLGRDTAAAKIFEQKSEEDFKRTQVVSRWTKRIAFAVLLTMNIFFAYYTVLYGFTQGVAWQQTFLSACIAQLFVEIFINETLEVLWMNFLVPTLVAEEVQAVSTAVMDSVTNLCNMSVNMASGSTAGNFILVNAPNYLFVSTNVAKAYPHLLESIIVNTFQSFLPGEVARKWHIGSMKRLYLQSAVVGRDNRGFGFARFATGFAVAFSLMKQFATAPSILQRMFVRSAQPFFVSAVILAYDVVSESPLYISIFAVALAACIALLVYKYLIERKRSHMEGLMVRPLVGNEGQVNLIPSPDNDIIDVVDSLDEKEGDSALSQEDIIVDNSSLYSSEWAPKINLDETLSFGDSSTPSISIGKASSIGDSDYISSESDECHNKM